MAPSVQLHLKPLKPEDIPDPESEAEAFDQMLDDYFALGEKLADSMSEWNHHSNKHDGTVQIVNLTSSSSLNEIKKSLGGIKEYWCGRQSHHTADTLRSLDRQSDPHSKRDSGTYTPAALVRNLSHRFSRHSEDRAHPALNGKAVNGSAVVDEELPSEAERQKRVMSTAPEGIYERFRRGLLEYHSENEREYIESCRETQCLHVYRKHVAEVWRLTYKTPPPTSPRTFVVLLLSRELRSAPPGGRAFMNISVPFEHPDCREKVGGEKARVRGKYVSVERVSEISADEVEWRMATSSDAGGNIPRFVTNGSLPNSIAEDVPSFLSWMVKRFPAGGEVTTRPVTPR